jgi:hypothetical protein
MKLIKEEVQDVRVVITEDKESGKKSHMIEGIFMMAETKNRNGRVYPFHVLSNEVNRYNNEYVNKGRALGELGHPDTPSVDLNRACILIKQLNADGNNFIGKAKILDTPMGNTVKGLLDGGVTLGVSTRGVGSLKPHNGYQLVQDDFKLSAVDVVGDPSAPEAFVKGIMENYDWWLDSSTNTWQKKYIEESRKQIRTFSKRQIEEKALVIFKNYLSKF